MHPSTRSGAIGAAARTMLTSYAGATDQSGESSTAPMDDLWTDYPDVDEDYDDDEVYETEAVVEYVFGPRAPMAMA